MPTHKIILRQRVEPVTFKIVVEQGIAKLEVFEMSGSGSRC
jgi:hypothetical protein